MEMTDKLRRLKGAIKEWNMKSDGNVDKKIKAVERKLSKWDDLGSSRKHNEVELEKVRRLNMELWDVTLIRHSFIERISDNERSWLEQPILMEEIKNAVWSCDELKVPSPDGFNMGFFKEKWQLVKGDLYQMMSNLFYSRKLEKSINSSFIALIPKSESPLISLVGSLYKIVAKILARRFSEVIVGIIFDGILVANEIIHTIRKKESGESSLIIKLDFSKAYNCVRWDFLDPVLLNMRFGERWRGWMAATARVAIEEVGLIKGIYHVLPDQFVSHLQFADDTILFLKAKKEVVHNVKYILRCFEIFSGLSINFKKSCLVGFRTNEEFLWRMVAICHCNIGNLPLSYFGIPLGANLRRVVT
ncbi:LINE-1 reverse transcriptase isogeny [Gossypium australe]|uniref:LINE-1 reverse transcriptase isogeny n=1 Tax=Gossypium australe TaxID=47621 RepID=A0A5B6VQZ5_9ROSI|nr:LINE-1 reverse transcriptase isogeny [Gossypium australe]